MLRTLYVGQTVQITTGPTGGARTVAYLPVQSASCEVTKPVEAVSAFGRLGSLALAQTNLTTCKSSVKTYLQSGALFTAGTNVTGITADLLSTITGDAVNGFPTVINVFPNGFKMSGILTSLGIDMALGGFGTADFSFNGVGQPDFAYLTTNSTTEQASMPSSITPVTTTLVSGAINSLGCSNSFKFSLDMPTDTLACLGDVPDAPQVLMTSMIATKPPYKANITLEGFGVDIANTGALNNTANYRNTSFSLGGLGIRLPNAIVSSKSFNNAVGTANASYNVTLEDTSATFGAG